MRKLLTIFLCSLFLISMISAWDWDNRLSVDNKYQMTIENRLGFGSDLATIKLINYTGVCWASECYAYYEIQNNYEDKMLRSSITYDKKRENDLKRTSKYEISIDEKWINYDLNKEYGVGKYLIREKIDVKEGETVDVVPNFYGVDLFEWAPFTGLTRYEYLNSGDDSNVGADTTDWLQQSFKVGGVGEDIYYNVYGVSVKAYRDGSSTGTALFEVYPTNSTGARQGTTVYSNGTLDISTIGTSAEWLNVTMTSHLSLVPNSYYALGLRMIDIDGGYFSWAYDGGGGYAYGGRAKSTDSGATWTYSQVNDHMFEIWGNETYPTVSIDYPLDTEVYSAVTGELNYTVGGNSPDRCWYSLDLGLTNSSTVGAGTEWIGLSASEGFNTWTVYCNNTEGTWNATTTFRLDSTPSIINITSPNGTIGYHSASTNISLNWSITEDSLDSCWYEYSGANYSIPDSLCTSENSTSFEVTNSNERSIIFFSNDTSGNVGSVESTWDYKIWENYFTFNNQTRAGDQEDFTLNITLGEDYDLTTASLIYNSSTESAGIFSYGQDRIILVEDYSIPLLQTDTNVTLYFNLILDDSTEFNTTERVQLVEAIFLDNCSTYTYYLFNISLFDEEEKTALLGDIEFNYQLLNKPSYEQINDLSLGFTNVSNALICSDINLTNQDFAQSIEVRYTAGGYVSELYNIQKADITEEVVALNLFDLNSNDSTNFKVTYQDSTFNFIENAIIQLQRKYISEDVYEVVEAPITSNEGFAVVHVDLDSNKYKATIVKNGEVLSIFDNIVFQCQSELTGECTQKLLGEINPQNDVPLDQSLDFSYSISQSNDTIDIMFSSPSGNPSTVNVLLEQKDQFGTETLCNKTITSSAGSVECSFDESLLESYLDLRIYKDGDPMAIKTYIIENESGYDFLENNFFIVFIFLLSIMGMALSSPEWIIINSVMTLLLAGALYLINGVDFVMGLGSLMWLVIAAGILIFKLSKQEDR